MDIYIVCGAKGCGLWTKRHEFCIHHRSYRMPVCQGENCQNKMGNFPASVKRNNLCKRCHQSSRGYESYDERRKNRRNVLPRMSGSRANGKKVRQRLDVSEFDVILHKAILREEVWIHDVFVMLYSRNISNDIAEIIVGYIQQDTIGLHPLLCRFGKPRPSSKIIANLNDIGNVAMHIDGPWPFILVDYSDRNSQLAFDFCFNAFEKYKPMFCLTTDIVCYFNFVLLYAQEHMLSLPQIRPLSGINYFSHV